MITAGSVNAAADIGLELRDIRGPVDVPGQWTWLLVLAGAAVLCAAFFWLWRLWARQQKKVSPAGPPRPAWETALEDMLRLERSGFAQKGMVKEYYSELSGIVRRYIEQRLNVRAPEMTTEEFMQSVQYSEKLTPGQQGFLQEFLGASDMVKFARFVPAADEMFRALRLAKVFVEETR